MSYLENIARFAIEHKAATAALVGGGCLVAAPMAVAAPLLSVAGFSSQGIAAGSLAAGIQAGIGNVVAGGAFATVQSAAMAGYGTAVVGGIVQGVGAAVAAGGAAYGVLKNGTRADADEGSQEGEKGPQEADEASEEVDEASKGVKKEEQPSIKAA